MPEMIVVNTSPIFYLHRLGLLDILHKLYGVVTIPEAVKHELEQGRLQGEDVPRLEEYPCLLRAKEKRLIPALKPVMERLVSINFRLKPDLLKTLLDLSGE